MVKRIGLLGMILGMLVLLWGCGAGGVETLETVGDVLLAPASVAEPKYRIMVQLPKDAGFEQALSGDYEKVYTRGDGSCTYTVETLTAVSLDSLLTELTGQSRERLTVIQTEEFDMPRYDLTWTAAGEQGEEACRAAILDDGMHYYVVTASVPAELAGDQRQELEAMFASMGLYVDEGF